MTGKDGNGFWYVQLLTRYLNLIPRTALVFYLQRNRIRNHLFLHGRNQLPPLCYYTDDRLRPGPPTAG